MKNYSNFKDGTSTLTFLPYISEHFSKEYIIPNYIGESLSSLVPGMLSLAQGSANDEECFFNATLNQTTNNTSLLVAHTSLNFSVSVYFLLMFVLLCISLVSFTLINYLKILKRHRRVQPMIMISKNIQSYESNSTNSYADLYNKKEIVGGKAIETVVNDQSNRKVIFLCYFLTFLVSFFYYGILPGIQSYSTLPYGGHIYRYAVNLSNCYFLLPQIYQKIFLEKNIPTEYYYIKIIT